MEIPDTAFAVTCTVQVAVFVTVSPRGWVAVAVMVTLPVLRGVAGVTRPVLDTSAMEGSELFQVTVGMGSAAVVGTIVAVSCKVLPSGSMALVLSSVMPVSTLSSTTLTACVTVLAAPP